MGSLETIFLSQIDGGAVGMAREGRGGTWARGGRVERCSAEASCPCSVSQSAAAIVSDLLSRLRVVSQCLS